MKRITVTVTGDSSTGKTTLVNHFVEEYHTSNDTVPTIAFDYFIKEIMDDYYGHIEFRIWDTSGDEKFCSPSITSTYYRTTNAILILFDVTSRESFHNVDRVWLPRIRSACLQRDTIKLCLVANKTDLIKLRKVDTNEAALFARQHDMHYIELSSIKSQFEEVRLPFYLVAKELIDAGTIKPIKRIENQSFSLTDNIEGEIGKSCCSHG